MHDVVLALVGGALVGLAATILLAFNGRIAGISGILGGVVSAPAPGERGWRIAFLLGLFAGGAALFVARPASFAPTPAPLGLVVVAGLLVGFGTRLGGGCTSGHGVCGISRFSVRSTIATLTFLATGALATFVVRHVIRVAR